MGTTLGELWADFCPTAVVIGIKEEFLQGHEADTALAVVRGNV